MKWWFSLLLISAICIAGIFDALSLAADAQTTRKEFVSRDANIDGASIHFTMEDRDPRSYFCMGLRKLHECGIRSSRYSVPSSP